MQLSPDDHIFWQYGLVKLNATIVFTWLLMFVLAVGAKMITAKLSKGLQRSRWQNLLEIVVVAMENQIAEVGLREARRFLGFIGTLVYLCRPRQPVHHHPRFQTADQLLVDDGGPCPLRVCGGTALWYRRSGPARLLEILSGTDRHHAAV